MFWVIIMLTFVTEEISLVYHMSKVLLILQKKEIYIYLDVINNDDYFRKKERNTECEQEV